MINAAQSRPLEDLIADLAMGVIDHAGGKRDRARDTVVRPVSAEFDLPIETRVGLVGGDVIVLADVPRTRTRTAFDLPVGRLILRISAEDAP
jgi:hypothetical protein